MSARVSIMGRDFDFWSGNLTICRNVFLLENHFTFFSHLQMLYFLKRRVRSDASSIEYSIFCQAKSGCSHIIVRHRDCPWQDPAQLSPPLKGSVHHPLMFHTIISFIQFISVTESLVSNCDQRPYKLNYNLISNNKGL